MLRKSIVSHDVQFHAPVVEGRSCFDIGIMTANYDIGRFASSSYLALLMANVSDMTALIDCDLILSCKKTSLIGCIVICL